MKNKTEKDYDALANDYIALHQKYKTAQNLIELARMILVLQDVPGVKGLSGFFLKKIAVGGSEQEKAIFTAKKVDELFEQIKDLEPEELSSFLGMEYYNND